MSNFIPYGCQDITEEDIQTVSEILKSDFLTQGPMVPLFEKAVSDYVGINYAFAMNSATSALHVACLALGLKEGDWLWTSPNTFVASANCGRYCGAHVDFVDIDSKTYNMSVTALEEKLKQAKLHNCLPKIVVPVHFAGQSCDMKSIKALADEYNFFIIEDASHAIGGTYLNQKIGNCRFSDITIFSFHPVKIITTTEGGMALTKDAKLADKIQLFRSHGITRDANFMTHIADGDWYYQQIELGLNYRMTELQAGLGISQLKRIDKYVQRRHELANYYDQILSDLPLILPYQHHDNYSALHLYPIVLQDATKRKIVFDHLRKNNIGVNVHYIPVHTQPYYQQLGHKYGDYPQAEAYYNGAISLPLFAKLSHQQQDFIVDCIKASI